MLALGNHLEMVDVDVEAAPSALGQRVRELLVCFTQDAVLGVLV